MYITAGQGQTTPGDKILMSTETSCHFGHLLQVLKNFFEFQNLISWKKHAFIHVYASGQGLTTPWGRKFDVNRNILSLRSFVASFKRISLKSYFIHFFSWFVWGWGWGWVAEVGRGAKFWCQQTTEMSCHFFHLLQVSKNVFEVWFYTLFSWFNTCI